MKKIILLMCLVCIAGCSCDKKCQQEKVEQQKLNRAEIIEQYNFYKENCPNGYEVLSNHRYCKGCMTKTEGFLCVKYPTKKEVAECIKETSGYFKSLSGEFEDWDTSDIPSIVNECNGFKTVEFD